MTLTVGVCRHARVEWLHLDERGRLFPRFWRYRQRPTRFKQVAHCQFVDLRLVIHCRFHIV